MRQLTMPKRVIIELSSFDKGGLQRVVLDSALMLDRKAFEPIIVTTGPVGYLASVAREAGLRIEQIRGSGDLDRYRRLIDDIEPSLSISHFSDVGYELFAERGIPNITFIHNVYAFLSEPAKAKMRNDDRFVTRYVAVSKKAAEYAVQNIKLPADKVVTIPNGLAVAEHEERLRKPIALRRSDLRIADSDYVFVNIASYNLHKGHFLIAAAMEKVLEVRQDIKVLCVGNEVHAPHAAMLREHLATRGLDKHILLPGYYPNIEDPMRIADAFLLPSFIEGWSIAMNEAMFYGKPMILTDTGGAAEVIEGNDIGLLLPAEYDDLLSLDARRLDALALEPQRSYRLSQPLADAMLAFAADPKRWAAAGQLGHDKIVQRYDFSVINARHQALMTEVAATPVPKLVPSPSAALPPRRENAIARAWAAIRWRYKPALCFYLANSLFMNWTPYRLRHWFLRRFCNVRIGRDSSIHMHCFITGYHIEIGSNTVINRFTYLDGRVPLRIGNNVNISHYTLIQTLTHDAQNPDFVCLEKPVVIGDHAWIGARAIICPGVTVGEGAVVAAGAVVTRNVEPYTIVGGNPATYIKDRTRDLRYKTVYFPLFDTDIQ